MTDPLDVLREPDGPVPPDPAFAARLRARIERALELPRGVRVSTTTTPNMPTTGADREAPPLPWRQGDAGYVSIHVPDVERAAAFYTAVLGWTYEPRGVDARMVVGQSMHIGLIGGQQRPNLYCSYAVGDVDAAVERVRAVGGSAEPPTEKPWGRSADCVDNQGTAFSVFAPRPGDPGERPPVHGARPGDVAYLTYRVADTALAREFYGSVLGWRFRPGSVDDGWQLDEVAPMGGIGGAAEPRTLPMWRVDDIEAAVQRVRAAGGTATDPAQQPYGITSECVDDQGSHFYLGQLKS